MMKTLALSTSILAQRSLAALIAQVKAFQRSLAPQAQRQYPLEP